jgi:hypothetical protein
MNRIDQIYHHISIISHLVIHTMSLAHDLPVVLPEEEFGWVDSKIDQEEVLLFERMIEKVIEVRCLTTSVVVVEEGLVAVDAAFDFDES